MHFLNVLQTAKYSFKKVTWGLPFPPNPIFTIDKTEVAPRAVLAGTSPPFSVLINQNATQEQKTINVRGV